MVTRYEIDVGANRRARKWSRGEIIRRVAWELLRGPMFAWSPRPMWGWRRAVLRAFGARVGAEVHIHPTVRIAIPWTLEIGDGCGIGDRAILYGLGRIRLGRNVTISQHAHLCAGSHDYTDPEMPLLKQTITIGDGAWICADAFVAGGTDVGEFAVVAARAVVVRDVEPWAVVAGTPARFVKRRQIKDRGSISP